MTTSTCTRLAVTLHGGKYRRRYGVSRLVEVRAYCLPPSACQHHITEDARQRWSSGTWNGAILYPIINVLCLHDVLIPKSRHGVYRPAVLNSTPYGIVKKHEKTRQKTTKIKNTTKYTCLSPSLLRVSRPGYNFGVQRLQFNEKCFWF